MKIIQYSFMHLQRILKDKKILLLGMLMPTLVLSIVVFLQIKVKMYPPLVYMWMWLIKILD